MMELKLLQQGGKIKTFSRLESNHDGIETF